MLFKQTRIGKNGVPFTIYKLRTIPEGATMPNAWGAFLRKSKLDELPQLLNVLKGEMTFVGPRPDVPGYADLLQGDDRIILTLKPGITGLASLKYRNEEQLLTQQPNPKQYNDEVIWPDKVRINKWYASNRTFLIDLQIIFYTLIPIPFDVDAFMGDG
ncbi:sugar transferase [Flavobacterium sp. HXWNR69]|uniref:Sugar transferase n=1 Tax=Flavobacterium fragile TaxID=2949085 RepID=A0ABT0TFG3_9FLAO|nr:sugar transferase [Flavobacterium sp. HXWNR69]MCL9769708.1 sugar transferase [Flavobacterium sp. HXWNR69]